MADDILTYVLASGTTFASKALIFTGTNLGSRKVRIFDIHVLSSQTGTQLELSASGTASNPLIRVVCTDEGKGVGGTTDGWAEGLALDNGCYATSGTGFQGALINYRIEL